MIEDIFSPKASEPIVEKECYLQNLPNVIFPLVQNYLECLDYLKLMNSSNALFKDIKFETVEQTFTIREAGDSDDENENNFEQLQHLFNTFDKVKGKYTSVGKRYLLKLSMIDVTQTTMTKFASSFANIYDIYISFSGKFSPDFDFSIFNNINKVSLAEFDEVTHISHGLQNIRHLHIHSFFDLESIDCDLTDLDELHISECFSLSSINHLLKVKSLIVNYCDNFIPDISRTEGCLQRFTRSTDGDIVLDEIPCTSLQYLSLTGLDPHSDVDDLNDVVHIPELHLHQMNEFATPKIPLFYGKKLSLRGYSLNLWTKPLENLIELVLCACFKCDKLPIFPNLRKLTLDEISGIEKIESESLPQCLELSIIECRTLRVINLLPKIRIIEVIRCQDFQQFVGYVKDIGDTRKYPFRKVLLNQLASFQNVKCLRNITDLTIIACNRIKSFDRFDETNLRKRRRHVILEDFDFKDCDLSGLGNIGKLELNAIRNLEHGKGIHDIHYLILQKGTEFKSFDDFHQLRTVVIHPDVKW